MEVHGIVQIDDEQTWLLPDNMEECTTQELLDAWKLTWTQRCSFNGFAQRAMRDIREHIQEYLDARNVDARDYWEAQAAEENDE